MTHFQVISLAIAAVAISGCASQVQTFDQISARIKSDPAPLIQYRGSDEQYHHVFYNPCAGPFILIDPISKLACADREFRLLQDEVRVVEPISYHEGNEGRRYNLYNRHEQERFFRDFVPRNGDPKPAQHDGGLKGLQP
jgi:hypothetical protein